MYAIFGTDKVSCKCLEEDRKGNQSGKKEPPKWMINGF